MNKKQVIFVIVEGISDEISLKSIFEELFSNDEIHIEVVRGDITADNKVNSRNIKKKLGDLINNSISKSYFKKSDFKEIIHIVDMDGAYVSDKCIYSNTNLNKVKYSINNILTKNVDDIIKRNIRKRENLDTICNLEKICGEIKYKVVYMSCNLDHVLFNKLNISDDEKEKLSYEFAKKYSDDIDGFLEFIFNSDFSYKGSFKESWSYVKEDSNSLKRKTNLNLCISEILEKNES